MYACHKYASFCFAVDKSWDFSISLIVDYYFYSAMLLFRSLLLHALLVTHSEHHENLLNSFIHYSRVIIICNWFSFTLILSCSNYK